MNGGEVAREMVRKVRQMVSRGGGSLVGPHVPLRDRPDGDEVLQVRSVVDAEDGVPEAVPEVRLPLLGPPPQEGFGMSDDGIVRAWIGDRQGNPTAAVQTAPPAVPPERPRAADRALRCAMEVGLEEYLPGRALESLVRSCATRDPADADEAVLLMERWRAALEAERKERGE